ncbi:MAG: DUF4870 domain-containing protein [Terracidiphilus sp.]
MPDPNTIGAPSGLSDDVASGLAYVTFIPAIIFLVVAPYNTNPKVKFHAWQSIFLAVAWFIVWVALTIVGFIPVVRFLDIFLFPLAWIAFFIVWLIAIIQAFQGKRFAIPVIGPLSEKQAGA